MNDTRCPERRSDRQMKLQQEYLYYWSRRMRHSLAVSSLETLLVFKTSLGFQLYTVPIVNIHPAATHLELLEWMNEFWIWESTKAKCETKQCQPLMALPLLKQLHYKAPSSPAVKTAEASSTPERYFSEEALMFCSDLPPAFLLCADEGTECCLWNLERQRQQLPACHVPHHLLLHNLINGLPGLQLQPPSHIAQAQRFATDM